MDFILSWHFIYLQFFFKYCEAWLHNSKKRLQIV